MTCFIRKTSKRLENGTFMPRYAFKYKNTADYLQEKKVWTSLCEKNKEAETISEAVYDINGDVKDGSCSGDKILIEEPEEFFLYMWGHPKGQVRMGKM